MLVEAGVIVGSILLALALDAWWDGVQRRDQRTALIEALAIDFETTRSRLARSISQGDSLIDRAQTFLIEAHSPEPIPLDSLRFLALGAFMNFEFQPAVGSYRGGVATGDLLLIQNRGLAETFAEFDQALAYFETRSRISSEEFYLGPTVDLRRELGSMIVLHGDEVIPVPEVFRASEREYRELARRPAVYGVIESRIILGVNLLRSLRAADAAAESVLRELRRVEVG